MSVLIPYHRTISPASTLRSAGFAFHHRCADGVEVALLWVRGDGVDGLVVCVCDRRVGAYFEIPTEPHLALDVRG